MNWLYTFVSAHLFMIMRTLAFFLTILLTRQTLGIVGACLAAYIIYILHRISIMVELD